MSPTEFEPSFDGNDQPVPESDPFLGFGSSSFAEQAVGNGLAVGLTTIRQAEIPRAIERLDDIVKGTEQAANQILDACSALDALGAELGGEAAAKIGDATTLIYEACAFQDLAGQRITNVTKTLGLIEGKLSELVSEFGVLADDYHGGVGSVAADSLQDLQLSGPQHPADAADQTSIDQLFADAK
jgi:chemotaxis protein CheZ